MNNLFLQALINENGELDFEKIKTILPVTDDLDREEAFDYVYQLLSKTNLDDEFILQHFNNLNLRDILVNSEVSEDIIVKNFNIIIDYIMQQMIYRNNLEVLEILLTKPYSTTLIEDIISNIMYRMKESDHIHDDMVDEFSALINLNANAVTLPFILNNLSDDAYFLLTASFYSDGITIDMLKEYIDKISYDTLITYFTYFLEQDNIENSNITERLNTVKELLRYKLELEKN